MNKKIIFLVLTLMVLTSFSTINFVAQPVSASPPLTGDVANATATVSTPYALMQSGSSSSASTTFSSSGSYEVYVHVGDADSNTANSTTVNQSVTPSAPLSGNQNLIHPMSVTLHPSLSSSVNPSDSGEKVTFTVTNGQGGYYNFQVNGTSEQNTTSTTFSYTFTISSNGYFTIGIFEWISSTDFGSGSLVQHVHVKATVSLSASQTTVDSNQAYTLTTTVSNGVSPYSYRWLYSTNSTPINGATSSSYTSSKSSAGSWGYYVIVTDSQNYQSTSNTVTVTVDPALTVSLASSENPADAGQSVTFTATGSGGSGSGYSYDFYVGGTSVQSGTSATYVTTSLAVGSDSVYVTLTDSNSYTVQSSTITQTIYADPTVTVSSNDNPSIVNNAVTFTASVTYSGTISTYDFYLNGASQQSGSSSTFTYTFTSTGTDTVYVVVTDASNGQATSSTITQTVNPVALIVSLGSNLNPSDVGQSITFTASASGGSGTYTTYDFFLNGVSQQSGSSTTWAHTFSSAGSYSIYVNVTDSAGHMANSNTLTQTVNNLPTVAISSSANPIDAQYTVTFTASASGGSGIYNSYVFYLQGALMQNTSSTTWSYDFTTAGSFNVYVIVYDSTMGKGTSSTISETVNTLPSVSILSNQNPAALNQQFTLSSAISGGTVPFTYQWYNSGTAISGATSSTYATSESSAGTYDFTVTITDSFSNHATSSQFSETVTALVVVTVTSSKNPSDIGQSITFTASALGGSGTFASYAFYISGILEQNTSATTYSYSFTSAGSFNVSVTAYDNQGNHGSHHITQTVYADPATYITANLNPADVNVAITWYSHTTGGDAPYSFLWGGSGIGASRNSSNSFPSSGTYTITLTVTDSVGYQVTASFTETINPLPKVSISSSLNPSTVGSQVTFTATVTDGTAPFTYSFYISLVSVNLGQLSHAYNLTQSGNYFNSSLLYFNYSSPMSIAFSQYSFRLSVTNLTDVSPNALVDQFTVQGDNFNYYATAKSGSHYDLIGYLNSTSSSISAHFSTSEYAFGILSFSYSPVEYSVISTSAELTATVTSQSGNPMLFLSLSINGQAINQVAGTGTDSISMSYPLQSYFMDHLLSPLTVKWTGTSHEGAQSIYVNYSSQIYPGANTHTLTVMPSANATHQFPLNFAPSAPSYSPPNQFQQAGDPMVGPVLLSNSQSIATSTNFDQMINMNWSSYSSYLNANVSNVRFYGSSSLTPSSELYAWMENNNTTSAKSSTVWVNLSTIIVPADGSVDIYITFLPTTASWSSHWGLAPQLSSTYGQFDNGASVFPFYDNFAGTTLSSKWNANGASYTVNNGLTYSEIANYNVLTSVTSFSAPYVIEYYGYGSTSSDGGIYFNIQGTTANENSNLWVQGSSAYNDAFYTYIGGTYTNYGAWIYSIDGKYHIYGLIDNSSNNPLIVQTNYTTKETYTTFPNTYTNGYFGPRELFSGNIEYWQWVRVRTYAPNGVMPTSSIGSLFAVYTITFTETGLVSGTWYANVTGQSSRSSTASSISFTEINGTYYFNVSTGNKIYKPSPDAGSFVVSGNSVTETITFTKVTYTVTFTESGLTSGTWYVNVSTTSQAFSEPYSTSTISFNESNGAYSFTVQTNYKIDKPGTASGTFTVNGGVVSETITFTKVTYTVTFTESGLVSGSWYVNLTNGQTANAPYSTSTITFTETNGSYSWNASTGYKTEFPSPSLGSFTVNGASVSISIVFAVKTYAVTFSETGLTSGKWYVNVTTTSQSFSALYSQEIIFNEPNGTYDFVIHSTLITASANPASGSFTISGSAFTGSTIFTIKAYYLQKILITNATVLDGLNTAGTNFLVATPNGTFLYTLLVSYTAGSSLNISVAVSGGMPTVELDEFPTFESYLTPSGYLENSSTGQYNWSALNVPSPMPTVTIGTGTVFQAAVPPADVSSILPFSEFPLANNNETYSYQIPVRPGTNYVTVNWNSSWQFSNQGVSPGTYILNGNINSLTFYDVSGFSFVQVSIIEPNIAIGQQQSVSLSLEQSINGRSASIPQSVYSEFSVSVSYSLYGSNRTTIYNPGSFQFTLPYGSNAIATVYDFWNEQVGRTSFSVPDSSMSVVVPLNMTQLIFEENGTGSTPPLVNIQSGNYNLTSQPPVYVKNGASYRWFVSAINPQTYQTQLYSNTITTAGFSQIVTVPIGSPISSLVVNVWGYSGSGIGEITNGGPSLGNPTAQLYINNVTVPFSSTFEGTLGEKVNISVRDVLGHVLFQTNIVLNTQLLTRNFNVTIPSYVIGFANMETVDPSSPLATQFSSISVLGSKTFYNFTTHVQTESEIYLASGYTYHLYTHDNLTDSLNISLKNQNVFYEFNSQNITSLTESVFRNMTISLSLFLSPITQIQSDKETTFTLTAKLVRANIYYNLTEGQTLLVMSNLTVLLSVNGKVTGMGITNITYVSPGVIKFDVLVNKTGSGYQLSTAISDTNLSGMHVSGSAYTTFTAVPYNPSNPPNPLVQLATGVGAQIFYLVVAIVGVIVEIYRRITKKERALKDAEDSAGVGIEGMVVLKYLNNLSDPSQPALTPIEQQMLNAIEPRVKDALVIQLTSGTVKLKEVKPQSRWRKIF